MTFKFSDKDRTIRIYNLRADTREFIGEGDAYIPAGTGLPADCTDIAPPDITPGMAAVFNGKNGRFMRTIVMMRYTARKMASRYLLPDWVNYLLM